jgi:hypothetical protein
MKVLFPFFILMCISVVSCKKFEDATPTSRTSLIHFYGGTLNYEGVKAELDADGGFIIIGNIHKNDFTSDLVVIKTNSQGQMLWQKIIPGSSASDIKVVSDGYLIAGDSIDYQPNPARISELVNTKTRLIKMDFNQTITHDLNKDSTVNVGTAGAPVISSVDFHGSAITFDNSGEIVLLGSYKSPETGSLTKSYLMGINPATFSINWVQTQEFLKTRDYVNSRALHLSSTNNLMWATTALQSSLSLTTGWLSIVYTGIGMNTTFKNNSKYGENATDHYFTGSDMQKSGIGFGVVGTYARVDNTGSNMYFIRVNDMGNIEGNAKYFDGLNPADSTVSETEDSGNAITGTQEGSFVMGGSMLSTPDKGNGGKDIVLIKVDAFGEFLWSRLIGGSGDEVVSSIRETSDGGLLVCGTNTVNGLSSVFIMKTDRNGELTN